MEEKKLRSLLRFYKKKNVEIELEVRLKDGLIIRGKIIKLSCIFRKYLVIQSANKSPIKIYFDDIIDDSIIPTDFINDELKKDKSNRSTENDRAPGTARSPISSKLRFEVLRRDKFVCQYCGACGPNVELEIDHVIPVSRGGTDDIKNLKICSW